MKARLLAATFAVILLCCGVGCSNCRQYCDRRAHQGAAALGSDLANYYSARTVLRLGAGFGLGATMAHTDADQELRDWWQQDVRSNGTDDFATVAKQLGEGKTMIPLALATLAVGELMPDHPVTALGGEWGRRSTRAFLVGAPPLLFTQWATGASRPGESSAESDWVPFHDTNGVSGHSFVGGVTLITAAKMTENRWLKATLYTGSTLAALSRVNDDAHYTSQAILGWTMAYLACDAVDDSERQSRCYEFTPVMLPEGMGIGVVIER